MKPPIITPGVRLGYGTGNPAGCPDFRPLNPWGRPMPASDRPPRPKLYQVHVKDKRDNRVKAVGPRMAKELAEMFRLTIREQISLGAERRWADPHLVMFV